MKTTLWGKAFHWSGDSLESSFPFSLRANSQPKRISAPEWVLLGSVVLPPTKLPCLMLINARERFLCGRLEGIWLGLLMAPGPRRKKPQSQGRKDRLQKGLVWLGVIPQFAVKPGPASSLHRPPPSPPPRPAPVTAAQDADVPALRAAACELRFGCVGRLEADAVFAAFSELARLNPGDPDDSARGRSARGGRGPPGYSCPLGATGLAWGRAER